MRKRTSSSVFLAILLTSLALLAGCNGDAANVPVLRQGSVTLAVDPEQPDNPAAYLDLDMGVTGDVTTGDISFTVSGGSTLFNLLQPVNGAMAGSAGVSEPGLAGCRRMLESLSEGSIPEVTSGNHVCVLTNQHHLSQLQIDEVRSVSGGGGDVQVTFITWGDNTQTD